MDAARDRALMKVLKEAASFADFFDYVFDFLQRKTDFFLVPINRNQLIGLPKGVAQQIILQTLKKYVKNEAPTVNPIQEQVTEPEPTNVPSDMTETTNLVPIQSDCSNGGSNEMYSWSQTISHIELNIKISENVTPPLHILVKPTRICIKSRLSEHVYLAGQFFKTCKASESIWSWSGSEIQIHLVKTTECWWDCLLQSELTLDVTKEDCSRPLHELLDEIQVKIEQDENV